MINMKLANGVHACYLQCHFTPDAWRNYTVIGTKGRIENFGDDEHATVQVWTHRIEGQSLEGDITYRMHAPSGAQLTHGGADVKIVAEFLDTLRGKMVPVATPQGARYAVATGILGAQSIRNGGMPYDIPTLPKSLENFDFSLNR